VAGSDDQHVGLGQVVVTDRHPQHPREVREGSSPSYV
jgi:hypothetical protein